MNYKKTTLKNGLRIITAPMKDTNTATVVVMVGVGSRYETEKEAGLSHFIEHMFFKGTEKRPEALMISEELDAIGGEFNAFTSKDRTAYYAKVDSRHMEVALDVVSDIYLNSKIDAQEIEKEKGTILQEVNMREDNPMRLVGEVFEELLYSPNNLGRDVIGYKKTIESFKRKDFTNFMKRFYVSSDTVICVAGKFDEKKIISLVKKYFFAMLDGKKPQIKKVVEVQKRPEVKIKFKKTDQTHLILGNRAYHENHKDRFAVSLMSIILGGNMSSRLFLEVREKRGLAYYVRAGVDSYEDCGYTATQAGVEHKNLEETIRVILQEYKKMATERVSEKELANAKNYIKGKSVMGLESSDEVAMFFIDQEIKRDKVMTIEDILAKFDKVTTSDILRVAGDIFQEKSLNLAIIGPHKNESKLKNLLKL
ncbi:MAG: Peptidase M16 domain protein [Candidatus Moranbacteria bacterium GW2011_GWA2_39_41]|nr:MAG: Peptidase M16 domain protein [Candidatus Moranbacteria bacterium GW2011_GWA2_39_41]